MARDVPKLDPAIFDSWNGAGGHVEPLPHGFETNAEFKELRNEQLRGAIDGGFFRDPALDLGPFLGGDGTIKELPNLDGMSERFMETSVERIIAMTAQDLAKTAEDLKATIEGDTLRDYREIDRTQRKQHKMYLEGAGWGDTQLGPVNIPLPPIAVNVSEVYSASAAASITRARTSSKINPGNKSLRVEMSLLFRTYDEIGSSEEVWGDLNSLRGLITLFRGTPFVPIRNRYLNEVWNVDMIALDSLQIGTVPGIPYAITANLSAFQFNWRAFVPIAGKAWDIVDNDRFLYHYSRCKEQLDDYVNVPFGPERLWVGTDDPMDGMFDYNNEEARGKLDEYFSRTTDEFETADKMWEDDEKRLYVLFGPVKVDHLSSGQLELYYTDRDMSNLRWLSRLRDTKTSDPAFLEQGIVGSLIEMIEIAALKTLIGGVFGADVDVEEMVNNIDESFEDALSDNEDSKKVFEAFNFIVSIAQFNFADDDELNQEVKDLTRAIMDAHPSMSAARAQEYAYLAKAIEHLEAFGKSEKILNALEDDSIGWIHEWEIPMRRMGLMNQELAEAVIVESIGVGTQNALTALPIAGKTSGVHQHMGNLGTNATITLKVVGERALQYMKTRLDKISYAAMKNKDAGVSGFLGVENHLLNLMGMKYAMLTKIKVSTIEGIPHAYNMELSLTDFDVLQQKREMPQAVDRINMMERMSIGNPIMRAHQEFSSLNAYPDMPLPRRKIKKTSVIPKSSTEVNDMDFEVVETVVNGPYYDPDYYFKTAALYYEKASPTVRNPNAPDDMLVPPDSIVEGSDSSEKPFKSSKTRVSLKNDGRGRVENYPNVEGEETYYIEAVDKFQTVTRDADGNMLMKTYESKEGIIGAEIEALRRERIYIPGENVMNVESWLDGIQEGNDGSTPASETDDDKGDNTGGTSTGSTPYGTEITDSDIMSAMSRSLIFGNNEITNSDQMMKESLYDTLEGRMIRAFPTCVVYLIDEGDVVFTYRLYDTFYGIQGLISASITHDKEATQDAAVLQFSNIYKKLSTQAWWQDYTLPKFLFDIVNRKKNEGQRAMGYTNDIESLKIEPGMRIQIRSGYGADPSKLPITFNGNIKEVSDDSVLTIVASGDGSELGNIMEKNFRANQTEGYHRWQSLWMNAPFVEPQQVLVKMLAGEGSAWSEFVKRAEAGIAMNQASAAAPHFGAVIWDTTMMGGDRAFRGNIEDTVKTLVTDIQKDAKDIDDTEAGLGNDGTSDNKPEGLFGLARAAWEALEITAESADDVAKQYWVNTYNLLQDFELYKRNIYPGNGTGMRGWETNPKTEQPVLGVLTYLFNASDSSYAFTNEDTDTGAYDERAFSINTGGKTNWQIAQMCEALMPNYILAVRPFEHRSTLFYGKPNWLYTSGVVPFFDADGITETLKIKDWEDEALTLEEVGAMADDNVTDTSHTALSAGGIMNIMTGGGTLIISDTNSMNPLTGVSMETKTDNAIKLIEGSNEWGWAWFKDIETVNEAQSKLGGTYNTMTKESFQSHWAEFMAWVVQEGIISDVLLAYIVTNKLYRCTSSDDGGAGWDTMHDGRVTGGPRNCDMRIAANTTYLWEAVTRLHEQWNRLNTAAGDGDIEYDDELKEYLKEMLDGVNRNSHTVAMDRGKAEELIDSIGEDADTDASDDEAKDDDSESNAVTEAMDQVRKSVAVLISEAAGGVEAMMTAASKNDMISKMEWRCLEDNSYYGVLAGTRWDPYAGSEYYADPENTGERFSSSATSFLDQNRATHKSGSVHSLNEWFGSLFWEKPVDKRGETCPDSVKRIRAAQIMTDNPFTKEFAEPVVEVREPFMRFHTITSETNMVANTLFLDETQVGNKIIAMAHAKKSNDGSKTMSVSADKSIPPHLIREKTVDTGLNYSMFNGFDGVNHKNMALYHLKRSLHQMYGGEIVAIGNGKMRPHDMIWMWDSIKRMNGMCEIERVTHHYSMETGYITSVKVAPIIAIEDAHMFHITNMFARNKKEEHAMSMLAQNVNAGAVDEYQATAESQQMTMEDVVVKTLGILDGNPNSGLSFGIASIMSPYLKDDPEKKDDQGVIQNGLDSIFTAISEYVWGDVKKDVDDDGKDDPDAGSTDADRDSQQDGAAGDDTLSLDNVSPDDKADATGAHNNLAMMIPGNSLLEKAAATIATATPLGPWIITMNLIGGSVTQALGAYFEEPIQVITLSKDGKPFQAGLRGSRGIIVGQGSSVPILTDVLGYEAPPADMTGVLNKFGFTLEDGINIRDAVSDAELMAIEQLEAVSGRSEMDVDDIVKGPPQVFEATIQEVVDGDTVKILIGALPLDLQTKVTIDDEDPSMCNIRMRYIQAPETPKEDADYEAMSEDKPEYGGVEVTDWLKAKLPTGYAVKIKVNSSAPVDDYGRLLAIIIDKQTMQNPNLYSDDKFLASTEYSWMKDSLNGYMLTSNDMIRIYIGASYQDKPLRTLMDLLFTITSEDELFIHR